MNVLILTLLSCCFCLPTISFSNAFTIPPTTTTISTLHHRTTVTSHGARLLATANDNDDSSSSSKERKPWDIIRFVSQSSKFITPPSLPFIGGSKESTRRKVGPGETLWTPSSSQNFFNFAPLDDVVMGGASSSTVDNNTGTWKGIVTDANNGGFVGIRSTPFLEQPENKKLVLDMTNCKGVELRLRKGDGCRYKFVVRDSTEFNGICWASEFDVGVSSGSSISGKKTTTIRIPFDKQRPTLFGNVVNEKTFDDENVAGFQFAYSKFEYDGKLNEKFRLGDFVLQILEIRTY
mmetsp:Transcript_5518/g.10640  ORF Transcript_5518/g.10640 Transcript_5518/m.10640 type:complete len:292 (-) Transcript_5518:58-933(-)|eukprot:CAMPEP_0201605766 /NCGR_PEP_ID=MMETSP0492-20130828/5465_1 /ASSEMBLY_ACC=CAM_ASM_000837 /TAXON_ID=420259 /ORGANISM="Thalassiosira gravida, Strain GMp14c1" /LENGTH=291 /DNA_ID=CAMNT_0048070073 /DNA_START=12 /DNA_END=887 /DNA_ORIENTATION=+